MSKHKAALREAMACADDNVILHTLEFRHSAFKDAAGNPTAIRIVRDLVNLYAPLEDTAPLNLGEWVDFIGMAFDFSPPAEDGSASPEITVSIDNVSRYLEPWLDLAANSQDVIYLTYRPYLSGHISDGVQMNTVSSLIVTSVSSTVSTVSLTARMTDIGSKAVFWETVTAERFPTLAGA